MGSDEGSEFQFVYPDYPVTKIEALSEGAGILNEIRITFIDGDASPVYGKQAGQKYILVLS